MTSAGTGLLEVAVGSDSGVKQPFPLTAIPWRMLLASFAIIGLRRSVGKVGEALEVAHVAQCPL